MLSNVPSNVNDNIIVNTSSELERDSYIKEVYQNINKEQKDSKSTLVSKNVTIMGRRTSVRLEPEMWRALKDISRREKCSVHDVCSMVYLCKKPLSSLTASIRVFLMLYYKAASTEDGHQKARHGSMGDLKNRVITAKDK
jgi:predicted DNA-binding ribbon-helix-helix protein